MDLGRNIGQYVFANAFGAVSVPEPAAAMLALTALCAICPLRRKRRKAG